MPVHQLPEVFMKSLGSPSNSSLSSTSSDVILISPNYVRNSRSTSISSGSTNVHDDDSIESSVNANNIRNRNLQNNEDIEEEESYQPIKLPSEPTLEELLRQVTGKSDLSMIDQVKLRIISSAISLQRLPYFMPLLRCLNLEGSMLFSLRDLGCDLSSLTYLNISRCGLKSLDGTNGLSTLTELCADHNLIEDAGPCSNIPHIQKISLVSNKIKDFSGIMFLGLCSQLRVLNLTNNAITQKENYRTVVKSHIPQLAILDVTPFEEVSEIDKVELSRSEYQTVLGNSGNIMRQLDSIQNNLQIPRPSTASSAPPITHISICRRPTTADKIKPQIKHHNLSVGEPVCGNIIAKVRRPRKLRHAWGDSASSSSSLSSDSSSHATPRNSSDIRSVANSTETLLENSRIWRQNSRETREKFNDR